MPNFTSAKILCYTVYLIYLFHIGMLKAVYPCVFKLDKLNVYHIQLHYEFQEIQLAYSNFKKVWDHLFNFFYHVITVIIVHSLPIIILLTSSFLICSFSMALIFLIMINHISKNTSVNSFSYNPWQLIRINVANLVLRWLRSSIIPPLKPLSNAQWLLLSLRTRLRILSLEKIQTLIMASELPHWKNFFLSNLMQARPLA